MKTKHQYKQFNLNNENRKLKVAQYKRTEQGKREKNDEIIHLYIEEFFQKFDKVMRSLDEAKRLSYKEHREDAQAPRAEEGRDKLRKAAERSKYPSTRRYPNEGTHTVKKDCISIYK